MDNNNHKKRSVRRSTYTNMSIVVEFSAVRGVWVVYTTLLLIPWKEYLTEKSRKEAASVMKGLSTYQREPRYQEITVCT